MFTEPQERNAQDQQIRILRRISKSASDYDKQLKWKTIPW